ncbi:MAG: 3-hydroxybutyryl-CoA dehydrogenase [Deltaproteobacteria bacterium]|nr:MAG: 3-hydroxybutyryl-CoA dehydrogenase [Deltaproteobacteria bacterium]
MEIKRVGVVGAGAMGSGIAQVCAQAGLEVVMRDIADEFVEKGLKSIESFMNEGIKRGKVTEEQKKATLARIKGTTKMEDLKDVDFVIEAVVEVMDIKKQVFKELDELVRPEVILSTNTSSLSITEIATATKRPDKVVGMHFFNPAQLMRLVEVVRGLDTSDETVSICRELAEKLGKVPVIVNKDVPGFIVNRIMMIQFMEAIRLYEEGVASMEDIDKAVKFGLNYPMGPFELMDLTGLDIGYHVNEYLSKELDHWPATPYSLKVRFKAGKFGRKSGEGWYKYGK